MMLKFEIDGLDTLQRDLAVFEPKLDTEIQKALNRSYLQVEASAAEIAPVYRSTYKERIHTEFPKPFMVAIGSDAPHAPFVEYDTRPHWPPIEEMVRYAHIKLKLPYKVKAAGPISFADARWAPKNSAERVGFLIAAKIARRGTKGQHIMERALKMNENIIERLFLNGIMEAMKP